MSTCATLRKLLLCTTHGFRQQEALQGCTAWCVAFAGTEMMTEFKRQTYSDQVAEYIRRQIRAGNFLPGEAVKEANIAGRLGISRAPVREALECLVQEGLLTSEPQKGKTVRRFTAKELCDSYIVGGILEGAGVAESLSLWTEENLAELAGVLRDMQAICRTAHSLEPLVELDERFHATLRMHCDNVRLLEMVHLSCAAISKCWGYKHWIVLFTPKEYYQRHEKVVGAIATRDPERVEGVLREHYKEIGRRMAAFGEQPR